MIAHRQARKSPKTAPNRSPNASIGPKSTPDEHLDWPLGPI
jgi:hypothetical protein